MRQAPDAPHLVLFGATGDLARRHLLPALARLVAAGSVPTRTTVTAVGREPGTTAGYRRELLAHLGRHAADLPPAAREHLVDRVVYHQADLSPSAALPPDLARSLARGPVVAYLGLPPAAYLPAVRALHAAGLDPASRIAVEKPFGEDGRSARELSELLHRTVGERNVFRVDHFLHHQTVQNLLALRWHNRLLEPVWSGQHVERVEITWEETGPVGDRAGFYDRTGALRDMVHSHLLQVLALVAMDLPAALDERSLRDAKVAALRAVAVPAPDSLGRDTIRGRYTAGAVGGRATSGYADLPGVDVSRGTETYVALRLSVDTPRWSGVPFELRTGKALGCDQRSVALHLRAPAGAGAGSAGMVRVDMVPERLTLRLAVCGPSGLSQPEPVDLAVTPPPPSLPPSARLLLDLLSGDPTFAVRDDEAAECWRVTDTVLAGWRDGAPPLREYAAGSAGPVPPDWPSPR